jgi:RNase P/RNase MRP subunit p29
MLVGLAAVVAIAVPAQARAGGFVGTVIAKQPQRGTVVLAAHGGLGLTVHTSARTHLGDRISLQGLRLRDGTIRASRLRVVSHTRRAMIRGVVVRELRRSTLVATGRSVITIRHRAARRLASASDHGDFRAGSIAEFRIRIDDDDLLEEAAVVVGQAGDVEIEGAIISVSPLVVSVEGLPITITVPAGMTLPAGLAAGERIELIVHTAAGNVFTLVTIEEIENENQIGVRQEVEVKGVVVSSSPTQIVVNSRGAVFTFAAPAGTKLPTFRVGTFVEVRGLSVNGVLTAERLKVEDDDEGGGSGGGH